MLKFNDISDVGALSGLTKLWELMLEGNPVNDYSPLKDIFPNLKSKEFDLN